MLTTRLILQAAELVSGTRFWSRYLAQKSGTFSSVEQAAERFSKLLVHAVENVPLWAERITSDGAGPFMATGGLTSDYVASLPITRKTDLKSGFPERVTSGGDRTAWRYGSSAGTVDRQTIISDFEKRDQQRATNLRVIDLLLGHPLAARIAEIPPDACNVVCALRDEGPLEFWPFLVWAARRRLLFSREIRPDLRGRIERTFIVRQDTLAPLPVRPYDDMHSELDECLQQISLAKPNILRGAPLFLLWLAERAMETSFSLPTLKVILPYGGLMSQSICDRVSAAFSTPVRDFYGTSEFGGIAISEDDSPYLKVFNDLFLVEILDEDNRPLAPGMIGKVVITDFSNYAMPMIRYEVGDYGKWISDSTSCDQFELSANAKLEILGRKTEMLQLKNGAWVSGRQVMDIIFADQSVLNASLQQKHGFQLKYAARGEISGEVLQQLAELVDNENAIKARKVSLLRPEESGKYRVVKFD